MTHKMNNLNWKVIFVDIDPDSGERSQTGTIAYAETERDAQWIKSAIEKDWYSIDGSCDPNREFYVKYNEDGQTNTNI
jgi:hypothetical protein